MEIFPSCSSFLKSSYAAGLLVVFIFICAKPAIKNYLEAGIIIERSWEERSYRDTPNITFCAQNQDGGGWKIATKKKIEGESNTYIAQFI